MKCLYFDAFSGISGDMTVGALLALGVPLEHVRAELARLPLGDLAVGQENRSVHGIGAVKFQVTIAGEAEALPTPHHTHAGHDHESHRSHHSHGPGSAASQSHGHRPYRDIRDMIATSTLPVPTRELVLRIFAVLAEAEGRIHQVPIDQVQFHEVGAVDSIVDIVATAVGVQWLGVERFYCSPLPLGSGIVRSQHGPIPVPAPATAELLRGFPTRIGDGEGELVTPTGAAIVAALARPGRPELRLLSNGYGAGDKVWSDRPNLLRLLLGEVDEARDDETLVVLQCNIDDLNPEFYEHVFERAFAAGAIEVYLTPVLMKKGRPGQVLTVLCGAPAREALTTLILSETSSIGLRQWEASRIILPREIVTVDTEWGPVRVKVARAPGSSNLAPEYEDCRRLALEHGAPLKAVYLAAQAAALRQHSRPAH